LLFYPIFCIKKDSCDYAKEKVLKKMDKCPSEKKKKKNNKDSLCFLAKFLSSKREINSSRSKSRIRISYHINTYPPYSINKHILI
jgi:monomeric isocitrate dehydrogenase